MGWIAIIETVGLFSKSGIIRRRAQHQVNSVLMEFWCTCRNVARHRIDFWAEMKSLISTPKPISNSMSQQEYESIFRLTGLWLTGVHIMLIMIQLWKTYKISISCNTASVNCRHGYELFWLHLLHLLSRWVIRLWNITKILSISMCTNDNWLGILIYSMCNMTWWTIKRILFKSIRTLERSAYQMSNWLCPYNMKITLSPATHVTNVFSRMASTCK